MEKVKCPRCNFVNPEGRDTCLKCRTPLPRIRIEAQEPRLHADGAAEIQFKRGQVLANRYTILNLIGRGGMGCIYKAHDNTLGEEVALKTLLPQFVQDKMVVERFFTEARIARKLAHPNIVRVHDIQIAGSIIYISMELLKGRSLRDHLQALPPGGRLDLKIALRVMEELCAALAYAHQYTVHRDIKPENVMLLEAGAVKLMDFGISKLMDTRRVTGASVVMGTPFYMAPEQLRNSRDVDARADIYSMGVMLYEILTGNMPTGVPKPASEMIKELPPAIDRIIARCVEPERDKRFASAEELRGELQQVRIGFEAGISLERQAQLAARRPMPWRRIAGATALIAIAAAASLGLQEAEKRRAAVIAARPAPAQHTTAAPEPGDLSITAWEAVLPAAIAAAIARAGAHDAPLERAQRAQTLWDEAKAAGDTPSARERAANAARYAAAAFLDPNAGGMAFIDAGRAPLDSGAAEVPPFLIDTRETTVGEFAAFCRDVPGGWRMPAPLAGLETGFGGYPAVYVSYYDAQAYAAWRGKRLPTEAQWVRAAMNGNALPPYPWGDAFEPGAANTSPPEDAEPHAEPTGAFAKDRSPAGLYDLAGNVSEWTRTPVSGRLDGPGSPPGFGDEMAVRGGSFRTTGLTLDARDAAFYETNTADDLGFRCVLELPAEPAALAAFLAAHARESNAQPEPEYET